MTGEQAEQAGTSVSPDDPMPAMRNELSPVPSLKRIGASARFTVSTVSVVATALTAFGLVAAAWLSAYPYVRVLAFAAAGAAAIALLCALGYLALRLEKRNWQNNVLVEKWYNNQFRRAGLVAAASWLLIVAVVLAGTAGTIAAVDASKADAPVLGLEVAGTGHQCTVTATVSVDHLAPGGRRHAAGHVRDRPGRHCRQDKRRLDRGRKARRRPIGRSRQRWLSLGSAGKWPRARYAAGPSA